MPEAQSPLEINIYQIADDSLMKKNRRDGMGWDWRWAPYQREWMDATHAGFAYRCLPLTIMNQTGWQVLSPVTFEATWNGQAAPGSVAFNFLTSDKVWAQWINDHFGQGIITWNTPFLWKTKPEGSRLLIMGPPNSFKHNVQPLTAMIESDWMNMSFTMNWKISVPHVPVRFEAGEPIFQAIAVKGNICSDLEGSRVNYRKLSDDAEVAAQYAEWQRSRYSFHEQKKQGAVKPDAWQRNYFQGKDVAGKDAPTDHYTRITPPEIHYG